MKDTVHLLHLEDQEQDALLVQRSLSKAQPTWTITLARDAQEFNEAMSRSEIDVILSDSAVQDIDGLTAMQWARSRRKEIPFIFVCGHLSPERAAHLMAAGATDYLSKEDLGKLPALIARALEARVKVAPATLQAPQPMERLISIVQELSLARSLPRVQEIVRCAARELTGADGATFVLREGEQCFYADEDAIAPLWKGCRFPMSACISGWAMMNRQSVVLEDIYADPRIPFEAYRPTFVKSLVMVPIRAAAPIGAIGCYWATPHGATPLEVKLLQALADSASIAIENVTLYGELEARVQQRTQQLEAANADLESFSYSVSHDLRAPLRSIDGFSRILQEDFAPILGAEGCAHLDRISGSVTKMNGLIEALLGLARLDRAALHKRPVDLAQIAREVMQGLRATAPDRTVEVSIPESIPASGDPGLLRVVMENLFSNAWKYSSKREIAQIEFGLKTDVAGAPVYFIRDNGAGFDPRYMSKLFGVFQRLHSDKQFPGTGVGLATVQRIVRKHGGRIWAEASLDAGATFYFSLVP